MVNRRVNQPNPPVLKPGTCIRAPICKKTLSSRWRPVPGGHCCGGNDCMIALGKKKTPQEYAEAKAGSEAGGGAAEPMEAGAAASASPSSSTPRPSTPFEPQPSSPPTVGAPLAEEEEPPQSDAPTLDDDDDSSRHDPMLPRSQCDCYLTFLQGLNVEQTDQLNQVIEMGILYEQGELFGMLGMLKEDLREAAGIIESLDTALRSKMKLLHKLSHAYKERDDNDASLQRTLRDAQGGDRIFNMGCESEEELRKRYRASRAESSA